MKSLPRLIARPAPPPVQTTILYQPIHTVSVAKGQNEAEIWKSLQPLLREAGGRWSVTDDRKGIHAVFQFKGFERTWEFMSAVADQCKLENHHPQWTNAYNKTHITWTTHRPEGLTVKDIRMAEFCDEAARKDTRRWAPSRSTEIPGRKKES